MSPMGNKYKNVQETTILMWGGKATRKYKGYWKTKADENSSVKCKDFETDLEKFKLCLEQNLDKTMGNLPHNMQAQKTNVSEVLKRTEAKQKDLALWKHEGV